MKLKLSLSQQLVLLMVTALVPLFGLSIINAQLNAEAALSRDTKNLEFSAALVAAHQARVIDAAHQLLASFGNSPTLISGDVAECQRYLATLKEQLGIYINLGIVKPDGYVRCHALGDQRPNVFVGDRSYVQDAFSKQRFVIGGYTLARISGRSMVSFNLPLMDAGGRVVALAFASMNLDELGMTIGVASLPKDRQIAIMDKAGIVLTTNPRNPALIGKPVASTLLQNAVRDMRTGFGDDTNAAGSEQIFAFLPTHVTPEAAFFVAVGVDKGEVLAPVRKQFQLELLVLTLTALLGGCFSWLMGRRLIVRPTAAIIEATRQLQQGRLDIRIPARWVSNSGELAQIATSFNRMAESLQAKQDALVAELTHSQAIQGKLLDVQRLAHIGYWQIEPGTQLITLSDEIYEMFKLDRADFDGSYEGFFKWIHPDDQETFSAARHVSVQTGALFEIEFRLVTPLAGVRWVHQFARVYHRADGKPTVGRTGVIQDITERKNAELAVIRSTDLLNRTGALAKVGGWELVLETMTPYWSEETYRIHDLDPSVGTNFKNPLDFYTVDSQPVMRAAVRAATEHATPWDLELPLTTAAGRPIWVRTQGRALLENGKVVRLAGVLQDITLQYEAQANLRLLEDCFGHINDMVMIMEGEASDFLTFPESPIVFVNNSFTRRMGYGFDELVGSAPMKLYSPKTSPDEIERINEAFKKRKAVQVQVVHCTKKGEEVWLESDISPIFAPNGKVSNWVAVGRDISQRRLAEQALIDSEQRYAALFKTAPVPMWVYDIASTRFLAVNHAAVKAYGFSAAEFLCMTLFDIRPESEHDYLRQFLADPEKKESVWHDRRKDGSLFAVETVSQPIQYDGCEARFVVILDRTTQEKAEKDVQNYLFTLQRAADAAQAITWHQTLEGTMQEIIEQARGVIGAHQGIVSLNGEGSHAQVVHAVSLSEKYAPYRQLDEPSSDFGMYPMVCENNRLTRMTQAELEAHPRWRGFGKHLPMRGWLGVPLIGRNGKHIGLLQLSDKYEGEFTKQDEYVVLELAHLASTAIENSRLLEEISQLNAGLEQKVIERTVALARQEALFRTLAEQAPQTVWTADQNGSATYFNRAWFELVGGELKDWSGYQWFSIVHPEDLADLKTNWKISRQNHSPYAGTRRLRAKDGSFHTMAYRASPVFDEQGDVAFWVGIDADITEIKTIEAALRLSNQELEAFSYSVSHDLRSPLNTVDGFSRLLAKQLAQHLPGDSGDKVKHYLTRIQAGVAQMGQLIEDLLSLSQVTRARLCTEQVDISVMAHHVIEEWCARQPERQVRVEIEAGLQAQADGRLLRVVMENLLANAWKFTSQMQQATICVGQKTDAAGLPVFFVKDNGAGFDMAYADKLFTPFQRLHEASEFSGTGIGLATVSRVISRHGGCIWAESAPGCGAAFFFTLPQGEAYRPG